jgi:hypothetical protein
MARLIASIALILIAAWPARAQIFRLVPADTTSSDFFGTSVAIDDSLAVVGASGFSSCGVNSGAAYVFHRLSNGDWEQQARLEPEDCREGIFFGRAVAISGSRAAVVAYVPFFSDAASNTIYIFEQDRATGTWSQTTALRQPPGPIEGVFGSSIALDGDRLLATSAGDASNPDNDGAAYVYDFDGGAWRLSARLSASLGPEAGVFGSSGALDGDRVVVSASTYAAEQPGTVYVFDRDSETGSWKESAFIRGILDFFISVDLDGDRIIVGESRAGDGRRGRARIFSLTRDGRWRPSATLLPGKSFSRGGFGSVVAMHGDRALVVGFDEQLRMDINIDRVVYLFAPDGAAGAWRQKQIIDVGDNAFGSAIDLTDGAAVIGQASETEPGTAYVVLIR